MMSAVLPDFSWGLGIEDTFIPQTRPGMRRLDEYELTAHYRLWREDFDKLGEVNAQHVRWGVPWYRVNPAPGRFEWGWLDEALDHLVNTVGCIPIIDLMHYGTPLWLENTFINHDYPERVAEYAFAFADRYRQLVRYYTPLNEPMVNALYCGRLGQWPPYLEGDDGYVKVLMQVCKGIVLTERALRAANPNAIIVQVEAVEFHAADDQGAIEFAADKQEHIFLPYDLFTGRVNGAHPLAAYLQNQGVADSTLRWHQENAIAVDIFGVNYYPFSGGRWHSVKNGTPRFTRGVTSANLVELFQIVWDRYQLPIMLTETALVGNNAERIGWMDESVTAVRAAQRNGVPMRGYTWWPLFDMIEWDYRIDGGSLYRYNLSVGLWKNTLGETNQLTVWTTTDDGCENDGWADRFAGPDSLVRERTPLADHFRAYATGAQ